MPFSLRFILGLISTLLVVVYFVSGSIIINNIGGPDYVEENKTDSITLDCDYETNDEDVVLKWFYGGLDQPIFQWITSQNHAGIMGPLKEYLDPEFYILSEHNIKMFRALRFTKVDFTLSGNYTCKVSSLQDETTMTKQLIIYSPPSFFDLNVTDDGEEVVATCNVMDVAPKPNVGITIDSDDQQTNNLSISVRKSNVNDAGYFNDSIELRINSTYLRSGITIFTCSLSIPGTDYSEDKYEEHYIENIEDSSSFINVTEDSYYLFHEVNTTEAINVVFDNGNITKSNGNPRLHPTTTFSSLAMLMLIYQFVTT